MSENTDESDRVLFFTSPFWEASVFTCPQKKLGVFKRLHFWNRLGQCSFYSLSSGVSVWTKENGAIWPPSDKLIAVDLYCRLLTLRDVFFTKDVHFGFNAAVRNPKCALLISTIQSFDKRSESSVAKFKQDRFSDRKSKLLTTGTHFKSTQSLTSLDWLEFCNVLGNCKLKLLIAKIFAGQTLNATFSQIPL